jgi:hypothetical protein
VCEEILGGKLRFLPEVNAEFKQENEQPIAGKYPCPCCGNITLRDIGRHEFQSTTAPLIEIGEGITIERLYAENIYQTTAEGVTAPFWENKGRVGELIEHGVQH